MIEFARSVLVFALGLIAALFVGIGTICFALFWLLGFVFNGVGECFIWLSVNSIVLFSHVSDYLKEL